MVRCRHCSGDPGKAVDAKIEAARARGKAQEIGCTLGCMTVFFLVLGFGLYSSNKHDAAVAAAPPPAAAAPVGLAEQLATINGGDRPAFERLLASIDRKVPEGEQQVADVTVKCWQMLNEKGIKMGLLEVMQALDASIPANNTVAYHEVAAAYVTLRMKGYR